MRYKSNARKIKIISIIVFALTINFLCNVMEVRAENGQAENVEVVYFYSPTCSSCSKVSTYFDKLKDKRKNISIKKLNVTDLENKSLLNQYCKAYSVPSEQSGVVPIVFVRNTYLYDKQEITEEFEKVLDNNSLGETKKVENSAGDYSNDHNVFSKLDISKLLLAAFLNGLNPCAFSMLVFFIMLLECKPKQILKAGMCFCVGKFLVFVFLGSVFYKMLSVINSSAIMKVINIIFIVIMLMLAALNVNDYIAIKRGQLGKIKAQLPSKFRMFNHNFLKNQMLKFSDSKWLGIISAICGMTIAATEFLCSGQIYLSSIVTIIQTDSLRFSQAFLYLIIYSLVCLIPIMIVIVLVSLGKRTLDISSIFTEKVHYIKLIYALFFLVIALILVIQIYN